MDELDKLILRLLNSDARLSLREIARRTDSSLGTVSLRIKRLEGEGVINGYIPVLDGEKLGYTLSALISIRIARGKLVSVQEKIALDTRVQSVYDITGEWDSVAIAHFRDRKDLNNFVKKLLSMENVERTNTQIALNIIKDERRWTVG
ncbi:MAG: AsnC family transcriptional regulator [Thermoplasmata archaeon HGW-Thermoplasmata-1]|nr:MAG: AsnC family transcriptional regulator [Thermoplasmata archaeon HGW-Thermoplasmata-1]